MKKIYSLWLMATLCLSVKASSQTITQEKNKIIYGICTTDSLRNPPFNSWFNSGFDLYQPAALTRSALQKINIGNTSIRIFFGSWCGDSKREVPRFLKLLSTIAYPEKQVSLIGVGNSDSLYKQSPGHEEEGMGIFRVPVFIVYRNGKEIGRVNEYPVESLEKDLLRIVSGLPYSPNYRSFALLHQWLQDGSLRDENISIRGMAEQLRFLISGEGELSSLSRLLLQQGKKAEALQVARMNTVLHPESAEAAVQTAKLYIENNEHNRAIPLLERAMELNKDPEKLKELTSIWYMTKRRAEEKK